MQQGCSRSVPLSPCCETCLTFIHSAVAESFCCRVMQVVGAAFSGMLWLQSWDNYRHAAGLSSSYHAYTWSSISAYSGTSQILLDWQPCSSSATCSALQPKLECRGAVLNVLGNHSRWHRKELLTEGLMLPSLCCPNQQVLYVKLNCEEACYV